MSILSITFHVENKIEKKWCNFLEKEFTSLVKNLHYIEKYIFSKINSSYIDEGSNYNLLIMFNDHEIRKEFLLNEIKILSKINYEKFSQKEVTILITKLNPIAKKL